MSGTMRLTDDAIRAALTPDRTMAAPAGLADAIRGSVEQTAQRRAGVLGWGPPPRTRLVLQLVAVGLLLVALALGALFVGSRLVPAPSVTTYHGGPARTGVMPGPGPFGLPVAVWQREAGGPFGGWSPAVVDDTVFVGDQRGFVTAFAEATGEERWQRDVGAPINSGVTVDTGRLIVGDDDGVLHVLDTASGEEAAQFTTGAKIHGSALVVDGVAFFGSVDAKLYALDLATYGLRWPPVATPGPISRAIAYSGGVVYAGSGGAVAADDGSLGAYDAATGELIWRQSLEPGNTSTPTVANGRAFVMGGLDGSSPGNHVFAFDARSGVRAWPAPYAAPGGGTLLPGAIADGSVYVLGTDGMLYVLDEATGSLQWTAAIPLSTSPNAAIVGQTLYVTANDRQVHALDLADPAHSELWAVRVPGAPGAPAVVNGAVYVFTSSGQVVKLADP